MQPTNQDEPTQRSGHLGSLRCDQSKTGTAIASIKAQILIAMGGGTMGLSVHPSLSCEPVTSGTC